MKRGVIACPDSQYEIEIWIEQREITYIRNFNWAFGIPLREAKDWHCKYRVITNDMLLGDTDGVEKIVLDISMKGFDNYVYVILQEPN